MFLKRGKTATVCSARGHSSVAKLLFCSARRLVVAGAFPGWYDSFDAFEAGGGG